MFGSYFERFYVIIFLGKDQPQSEGSRHTDHASRSQVTAGVVLTPQIVLHVCASRDWGGGARGTWQPHIGIVTRIHV